MGVIFVCWQWSINRLRTHWFGIQNRTVAAMQMIEKKVWAHRSYLVWMRRQSLSFPAPILDFMAFFVQLPIIVMLGFPIWSMWDARQNTTLYQGVTELIWIIALISQQLFGWWQFIDHQGSAFVIAHLPLRKHHRYGSAFFVTNRMKFGVQTTNCATNMSWK